MPVEPHGYWLLASLLDSIYLAFAGKTYLRHHAIQILCHFFCATNRLTVYLDVVYSRKRAVVIHPILFIRINAGTTLSLERLSVLQRPFA